MGKRYRDLVREHGSQARGNTRAVLNMLADYADNDGYCFVGYATLADNCGISERTINRATKRLIELGELEIVEGGNGRGRVTNFHLLTAQKGDKRVTEFQPNESKKGDNLTEKGDKRASDTIYRNPYEPEQSVPHNSPTAPADDDAAAEQQAEANYQAVFGNDVDFGREPSGRGHDQPEPKPPPSKPSSETRTPQQAMFHALCEAMGWDYQTLSDKDKGMVAQAGRILREAGYTAEDIGYFMTEIWFNDWRWTKNGSRPRLNQIRQEIGKLRAPIPADMPTGQGDDTNRFVDNMVERIKANGGHSESR